MMNLLETILWIALIAQGILSGIGVLLIVLTAFLVVAPELGITVFYDMEKIEDIIVESGHPACRMMRAMHPLAFWMLNIPVFLHQRFIKRNTKSTLFNPLGE